MKYIENPFYILGASAKDNRRKIVELAESGAFRDNSERYTEARNLLTNPQKRISAEIRWFLDCDTEQMDEIREYIAAVRNGENAEEPHLEECSALTQLNVKLAAVEWDNFTSVPQAKHFVLSISRLFENLDTETIRTIINDARSVAGFPLVERVSDVEAAVAELRNDIRHVTTEKLQAKSETEYAEIINLLAESYSDNRRYAGHTILEDAISEYQLFISAKLNEQQEDIITMADYILRGVKEIRVEDAVSDLLRALSAWDSLAQPLQLLAKSNGSIHGDSERLLGKIRGLSIKLHNDHGYTQQAILITEKLLDLFKELPKYEEMLQKDLQVLEQVLNDPKANYDQWVSSLKQKYANRTDRLFEVSLPGTRFKFATRCISCLCATKESIQYPMMGFSLPMCQKCQDAWRMKRWENDRERRNAQSAESEEAKRIIVPAAVVSSILGTVIFFILYYGLKLPAIGAVIAGVTTLAVIFSTWSKKKITVQKMKFKTDKPLYGFATVWGAPNGGTVFSFSNGAYAELFADANDAEVAERLKEEENQHQTCDEQARMVFAPFSGIFTMLILGLLAVAMVCGSYAPNKAPSKPQSTTTTTTQKPASTTTKPPVKTPTAQTMPSNGYVFYSRYTNKPCQFEVENNSSSAYYMKFVDTRTDADVIRFFVRPYSTATVDMPTGTYELRYAYGSTWYGTADLFGSSTRYQKDEEAYPFTSTSTSSTIWTVSFYGTNTGMDSMYVESIGEDEF